MNWDTIQQFIRIALYSLGSAYFGSEFADGEVFQAAIGGAVAIGAFIWWLYWEKVERPETEADAVAVKVAREVDEAHG